MKADQLKLMYRYFFIIALFFLLVTEAQAWIDFTAQQIRGTLQHGQRVIPVDLDFDGDTDLITSYSLSDEVSIEINDGNGNFQAQSVGSNIVAMYALPTDIDGDGDLDIVAVGLFDRNTGFNTEGLVIWYEQNGSLNNWIPHPIDNSVIHPRYIDIADIDNDGDQDFAIISSGQDVNGMGFGNVALWYQNQLSGSNWTRWTIAAGLNNPESIRIGSIDQDSSPDILVAEYGGGRILWYASENNPAKNNWAENTISSAISTPTSARLYDMDNDNDLDIVCVFDTPGQFIWFEHPDNLNNSWNQTVISNITTEAVEFTRGDFNNDGLLDFALGSYNAGYLSILENTPGQSYITHTYDYFSFTSVEAADADGDGDLDLFTSSYDGHRVDWWQNNHPLAEQLFADGFEF